MDKKEKQLKLYCTDEEFAKINANAARFSLKTGTYLRLLGLSGQAPYAQKMTENGGETKLEKFASYDIGAGDVTHWTGTDAEFRRRFRGQRIESHRVRASDISHIRRVPKPKQQPQPRLKKAG